MQESKNVILHNILNVGFSSEPGLAWFVGLDICQFKKIYIYLHLCKWLRYEIELQCIVYTVGLGTHKRVFHDSQVYKQIEHFIRSSSHIGKVSILQKCSL